MDLLGHSLFSWCVELLDEHTYFDTPLCILMRHWIGDVSNKTIYKHIQTDCKVHYSKNVFTPISAMLLVDNILCYLQCYLLTVYG